MPTTASKTPLGEAQEAKHAYEKAWEYFHGLFPSISSSDVELEEVEQAPDGKHWLVTLSYQEMRKQGLELPDFLRVPRQKFKTFKINRSTGNVVSMKMRNDG